LLSRKQISDRIEGLWARLRHIFPERQILIRDHGKVRCFTLGTVTQMGLFCAVSGVVLWGLLATAAYIDKAATLAAREGEISRQVSELNGIKGNYQAAVNRLNEFQGTFSNITCEISDIQDSLLRIAARNAQSNVKKAPGELPKLDPQAGSGCRDIAAAKAPVIQQLSAGEGGSNQISAPLPAGPEQDDLRRKVNDLQEGLDKLKASHGAFLEKSATITANRYGEIERKLASMGVDAEPLVEQAMRRASVNDQPLAHERFGRGGPFVAAPPPPPGSQASQVALFNDRATRLDSLTLALNAVPLAEPLHDYELTSPFGARNDPINALSGVHEGVDLGAPEGTPVLATGDGTVVSAGWGDRYGNLIEIDHGMGIHTRYAHLSKILIKAGDKVLRGKPIGLLGETGRTTGPHLHYEVRVDDDPTNPMKFITAGRDVLKTQ